MKSRARTAVLALDFHESAALSPGLSHGPRAWAEYTPDPERVLVRRAVELQP